MDTTTGGASGVAAGSPAAPRQSTEPAPFLEHKQSDHASVLLAQLNAMRADETSADTVLVAGSAEFPCHRAVLAASSPYFRAMFRGELRESRERRVKLDGVTALVLQRLVDYIYTGCITVTVDDAQDILAAACLYQYADIVDACCRFLRTHLHPANCLGIEAFARLHNCSELASTARRFVLENFAAVAVESDEFLELPVQCLETYISSNEIEVCREEAVFEAVVRWVNADVTTRQSAACSLIRHIRFASIDSDYLATTVLPHYLVAKCARCTAYVSSAVESHAVGARPSTIAKEVLVVVGGFDNCNKVLASVESYNPAKNSWKSLPDVPEATIHCGVAAVDNDIYVTGGVVNSVVTARVWRFISAQQQWVPGPALIAPRAHHTSSALGKRLYVVGGSLDAGNVSASIVNTIECLDVTNVHSGWRVVAEVPCPRYDSHVVAYSDKALVEVGGFQAGTGVVGTIEIYSCRGSDGNVVYSGEQYVLPEPIQHAQISAVAGVLYVIWMDTMQVISLNAERRIFRKLADLHHSHIRGAAGVVGNRIYVTGGTVSLCTSDKVECYSLEEDQWISVQPMMQARECHGCVMIHMR